MPEPSSRKNHKARKCPVCGRGTVGEFKPFCSKRCADADLARWLKGAYAIPGEPVSETDLDAQPDAVEKAGDASRNKPKN